MNDTVLILIMEIIGTIAFSVSGSLVAINGSLDLFGIVFVGCITAVGGGILRDILMGQFPPNIYSDTKFLAVAMLTSLLVFVFSCLKRRSFNDFQNKLETINNYFDAIGLSAFTITGVEMAVDSGFLSQPVFVISMGFLTGIGGGIIRDVLVDKTPYVLRKHIYALASIIGGCIYYVIRLYTNKMLAVSVSMVIIILIRVMATKYHWKLPKIDFEN